MSDLEDVVPQPVTVRLGNETLQIHPVRAGQLPAFLRHMQPLVAAWNAAQRDDGVDWIHVFAEAGEDLLAVISSATTLPADRVRALQIDEFIDVFDAVLTVNADFFARRVMPALKQAMTAAPPPSAGPTSSDV